MIAPIIVDEHGDTMIFESVSDAATYLEAIDVKNGEYTAFDSQGTVLSLRVDPINENIIITDSAAKQPDTLRELLSTYLQLMDEDERWLNKASLSEMAARALELYLRR